MLLMYLLKLIIYTVPIDCLSFCDVIFAYQFVMNYAPCLNVGGYGGVGVGKGNGKRLWLTMVV